MYDKNPGLGLCLAVLACSAAAETPMPSAGMVTVDIKSQPVGSALNELAQQSGMQVIFYSDVADGIQAQAVAGTVTPDAALKQLLSKTGLTYEYVNSRTVAVQTDGNGGGVGGVGVATPKPALMRLAALQTVPQVGDEVFQGNGNPKSGPQVSRGEERRGTSLEEVIVTAQKREQRAFDVPISIVAMGGEELQRRKVTSLDDLSLAVPGLFVQSQGSNARLIVLRGVSNPFGSSPLVGLYLNEASVTSGPFAQLDLRTYDLERVEVLRGPQGTLYGEGSAGGTVRFITKRPELSRFATSGDVTALFTEDGGPGGHIEGMLNMPLIENQLGLRLAGTFEDQEGWIDQPAAGREDINDQSLVNVRAEGLWRPVSQFAVSAMAVFHRNDAPPNNGEDAEGNYTQVFGLTTTPSGEDDYELYNLTLTYDFAAAQILSATSYLNQDKVMRNLGSTRQLTPPGTQAFHVLVPMRQSDSKIFTEEFRLVSSGSGPWQWTIGGLYRDAEFGDSGSYLFALPDPNAPLPDTFQFETGISSKSWAVFGETSYALTDRLTVGIGLRYFEDDQRDEVSNQAETFDTVNPRAYVQYKITDQINTYASAGKGFRSGGFNGPLNPPTFEPESVWTYELGTKMLVADGRLGADVAVFYTDYTDYQISAVDLDSDPPRQGTINAGDARVVGIEWAFTWRPADQWTLGFNGNYVDSEFVEINATSATHEVGDPLDFFPEYTYTALAQRDFDWSGRPGFVRLDYNEQGRMTYRNRSIGSWYYSESDIIGMLNLHARLQWTDNLSAGFFGQNLLNDRGISGAASIEQYAARPRPRTFGIEFGMAF